MLPCLHKQMTGYSCPGCGLQRSVEALLQGEIMESLFYYPALIPATMLLLFLGIHLKFKFSWAPKILWYGLFLNISLVFGSYFHKVYTLGWSF